MSAQDRAAVKRARKAAKREEDARRTAEGPAWKAWPRWWERPHALWDAAERHCAEHGGWVYTPRWRARIDQRRSLPWVGRPCEHSEAQFLRMRRAFLRLRRARAASTRGRRMRARDRRLGWPDGRVSARARASCVRFRAASATT